MSVNAFGQASTAKTNSANADLSAFLKVDGTRAMTGILDLGGNKIANIQTPSASGDVATKSYADTKLPLTGGTIVGSLTIDPSYEITQSKAPSANNSLTNKSYVDTALNLKASKVYVDDGDALKLDLAGGTMQGNISMGFNRITNLPNPPTGTNEAACKAYVDSQDALKLSLTGGTMTGNIVLTSPAYIQQQAAPAATSTLCNKAYVDGKLALTGGTMTGNITMGSTVEVLNPKAPSTANSVCNKTYVDTKLPLAGGSLTGNLTMSGTTEVIQATAPSTANSLCNKTYVDKMLPLAGGTLTGDLLISKTGTTNVGRTGVVRPTTGAATLTALQLGNNFNSAINSSIGTSASNSELAIYSPGKATIYGNLDGDTTDTPYQVMKAEIVAGANNTPKGNVTVYGDLTCSGTTLGCTGVASRPTVAGDSKNIALSLGNSAISCLSSLIGVTPQESSLTLLSPGKTSFVNCVSSDSLPTEVAKVEAVTVNGATKGLMTVNGDIDLGPYKSFKVTNSADPVNANDLANKNYVDGKLPRLLTSEETISTVTSSTDLAMSNFRIRNISTTMGAAGGSVTIVTNLTKTPINGKLIVLSVWLERSTDEWFNVDNTTIVGGAYTNFQMIYHDVSKSLYLWWSGTKPTAWSGRVRVNLLELP